MKTQELLNHEADTIVNEAQLIGGRNLRLAVKIISNGDSRRLKALASKIKTHQDLIVVLAYQDTNSRLTIARSDHITHNANRIIKQLFQEFGGRGGGRSEIAHAGGFQPESLPALIERAAEIIKAL